MDHLNCRASTIHTVLHSIQAYYLVYSYEIVIHSRLLLTMPDSDDENMSNGEFHFNA